MIHRHVSLCAVLVKAAGHVVVLEASQEPLPPLPLWRTGRRKLSGDFPQFRVDMLSVLGAFVFDNLHNRLLMLAQEILQLGVAIGNL